MSTRDWMRSFDAMVMRHDALFDRGVYRANGLPADAPGIPVDVKLDRNLRNWDAGGVAVADYDTSIGLQLAQVGKPAKGARVVLDDGEAFELCERIGDDGSLSTWGVRRG